MPHFLFPSICWWTSVFLPPFGYFWIMLLWTCCPSGLSACHPVYPGWSNSCPLLLVPDCEYCWWKLYYCDCKFIFSKFYFGFSKLLGKALTSILWLPSMDTFWCFCHSPCQHAPHFNFLIFGWLALQFPASWREERPAATTTTFFQHFCLPMSPFSLSLQLSSRSLASSTWKSFPFPLFLSLLPSSWWIRPLPCFTISNSFSFPFLED